MKKKPVKKASALAALREKIRGGFGRHADDVWGVFLLVGGILLGLAAFGLAGPFGRVVDSGLRLLFGVWTLAVPVVLAVLGITLILSPRHREPGKLATGFVVTFVASLAFFHLLTGAVSLADSLARVKERGGAVGSLIAFPLRRLIGFWGAAVILVALIALGVLLITRTTLREVGLVIAGGWHRMIGAVRERRRRKRMAVSWIEPAPALEAGREVSLLPPRPAHAPPQPAPRAAKPAKAEASRPPARPAKHPAPAGSGYKLPPLSLLSRGPGLAHDKRTLEMTAHDLDGTLAQHGVDAQVTHLVPGPTVTRYEIELGAGVKVAQVTRLYHDIAYALANPDIRLLAPIPGRSAIGVEVPNRHRRLVTLGDILSSPEAEAATHPLCVGLGMSISGRPVMLNLSELPHVLIAGATGAGKSSCINALVTSLLMRTTPEQVRLILVDPKRVELGQYNDIPHLLTRVINNPKKAADALQWVVREMDRRYLLLEAASVRDIEGYYGKYDSGNLDPTLYERFPYVVVVIDELNDLMMVSARTVEFAVERIAQMARAVGIHLVIATQRPSVDVITGVIKANIPSRMAFSVASQTDSRVILDMAGAEKLVGLGDMILVTAREPRPERIQGAFVREDEIHSVTDWVRAQRDQHYETAVLEAPADSGGTDHAEYEGEDPEVMRQAIEAVVRSQLGSTSMLQRKLRIGFARAGRVMDILEHMGIVGPSEGSKARAVLVAPEELDDVLGREPVRG
ncbi:MAG: DNA translocase FtsK 4TM domain-containing protein [Acidimicrobiia bacterium]|nr:DNA translocase FtsK 4TM domain-containing protein [Acidimicrobiia bacterium]